MEQSNCIKNATPDQLKKIGDNITQGVFIDINCITDNFSKLLDQNSIKYKNDFGKIVIGDVKQEQVEKILKKVLKFNSDALPEPVEGASKSILSTLWKYKKWVLIVLIVLIAVGYLVYKFKFQRTHEIVEEGESTSIGWFQKIKKMFKKNEPTQQKGGRPERSSHREFVKRRIKRRVVERSKHSESNSESI
jgi:hypothetical protein